MNISQSKKSYSAFAAVSMMAAQPGAALAGEAPVSLPFTKPGVYVEKQQGAAERIDIADRLRTMSQEISAAACQLHTDMNAAESRAILMGAHKEFLLITDALLNGSAKYNITGHETRPRTLHMITDVISAWTSTDTAMMRLLEEPGDEAALNEITQSNVQLYDAADALIGQLVAEYSNPFELLLGDAVMIDLSGRLSLMAQKISNDVCAIWKGNRSDALVDDLSATVAKFGISLTTLRNGDKELGVKSAPTVEIERALDIVQSEWNPLFRKIDATIADEAATADEKAEVLEALTRKMMQLDRIVDLYTDHARVKAT